MPEENLKVPVVLQLYVAGDFENLALSSNLEHIAMHYEGQLLLLGGPMGTSLRANYSIRPLTSSVQL
jgi:hypothetical protein